MSAEVFVDILDFFFFFFPTGTLDWKDHILSMASAMAVFQKFKVV